VATRNAPANEAKPPVTTPCGETCFTPPTPPCPWVANSPLAQPSPSLSEVDPVLWTVGSPV
jgi:hypothetical protein